jgi:hypothetical protein
MRTVLSILEEMHSMKPDNGKPYSFLMSGDMWTRLQQELEISTFKGCGLYFHEAIEEDTVRLVPTEALSEIQQFLNGAV